jgi:hypothetical protein
MHREASMDISRMCGKTSKLCCPRFTPPRRETTPTSTLRSNRHRRAIRDFRKFMGPG